MNWCKPHWDKLRDMIEAKGLTKFVPTDGKEAARRLASEEESLDSFDPLMGCWMRINARMLESPGLNGRMMECPLCILVTDKQPELVDSWLNGVTDNALDYAIEKGWVTKQ